MSRYQFKTDDLLLRLLRDYHDIDVSEAMSFFGERAVQMLDSEPNVNEKSRSPMTFYVDQGNIKKTVTFTHRYKKGQKFATHLNSMANSNNKIYVLRGFFPNTHLPFKMTLVKFEGIDMARGKITIGLKEHHTRIDSEDIDDYNEAITEAILLSTEVKGDEKVKYKYRAFKCMRPKGMKLYHEKK